MTWCVVCPKCQTPVPRDSKAVCFCDRCGEKIRDGETRIEAVTMGEPYRPQRYFHETCYP